MLALLLSWWNWKYCITRWRVRSAVVSKMFWRVKRGTNALIILFTISFLWWPDDYASLIWCTKLTKKFCLTALVPKFDPQFWVPSWVSFSSLVKPTDCKTLILPDTIAFHLACMDHVISAYLHFHWQLILLSSSSIPALPIVCKISMRYFFIIIFFFIIDTCYIPNLCIQCLSFSWFNTPAL